MTVSGSNPISSGDECFSATRALCNTCGSLVDARIVFRGNRVFLVKWCEAHGPSEALVSADKEWYLASMAFIKPGTDPKWHAVTEAGDCPDSCGLCARHEQHTCLPIVEITGGCDLDCPICLVDRDQMKTLSLADFRATLDGLVRAEGTLNMLNLSGGEPTLHPLFPQFIEELSGRPEFGVVSVSTNGLRLMADAGLRSLMRDTGTVVSLQFDGFDPATSQQLRGDASLAHQKQQLLETLLSEGVNTSLTVTLARGVNEHELVRILRTLFDNDHLLSVMIQPLAAMAHNAGKPAPCEPDPLTIPDVIDLLEKSSGGVLERSDFTPLPCSHPSCFALTYLLKTVAGNLVPLPRIIQAENYLDIIKNQALFRTDAGALASMQEMLYELWSASRQVPRQTEVLQTVKEILKQSQSRRGPAHQDALNLSISHVKSVFIHHFMDRATFDQSRVIKCCNHYPLPDGRLIPACVRNNLPQRTG